MKDEDTKPLEKNGADIIEGKAEKVSSKQEDNQPK